MRKPRLTSARTRGRLARSTRSVLLVVVVLLPAVALSACGGSGGGQAGPAIKGTIVFASPHGRAATIELLDSHGVRRLARDGSVVASHPVWSPDGKQIAYVNRRGQLVVINRDGSGSQPLTRVVDPDYPAGQLVWSPSWTPDGRIAYVVTQRIVPTIQVTKLAVIRPDGTGLRELTNRKAADAAFGTAYAWSPDGKRIVFDCSSLARSLRRICLYDPQSGAVKTLAETPRPFYQLAWSPDGGEILAGDASDSSGQGVSAAQRNLYVLRANGHGLHALAKPGVESDAVWSPDGKMIVYASDRNSTGRLTLWAMNEDGSRARRLSRLDALQPSWTAH